MPRKHTPESFTQAFWAKVNRSSGDCWTWTGARNLLGYGMVQVRSRRRGPIGAHRIAYELAHGPITDGLWVLHHCDNPPCCRPDHLFLGTVADNVLDMIQKGRRSTVRTTGEHHGRAKLSRIIVQDIRERYEAGGITMADLGRTFGVSASTICGVVNRSIWQDE